MEQEKDIEEQLVAFVVGGLKRIAFHDDGYEYDYDEGSLLILRAADEIKRLRKELSALTP